MIVTVLIYYLQIAQIGFILLRKGDVIMTDLHMHTIHSDGSDDVETLLKNAESKKLNLISITDHNSVQAYKVLKNPKIRKSFSGEILPGAEFSTSINGETIEILGYGIDPDKTESFIDESYLSGADLQLNRFDKIYRRYTELGLKINVSIHDFNPNTMFARPFIYKDITRNKENLKFFKYSESFYNYDSYIRRESNNPESLMYVSESDFQPTPNKVIDAIHNAGGLAFIAHMFLYSEKIHGDINRIISEYNPDGFECYYSKFSESQTKNILKICRDNNLLISGGSDYHGSNRPGTELGTGLGNLCVSEVEINKWARSCLKL